MAVTLRQRLWALALTILVGAVATLFAGVPAAAAAVPATALAPRYAPSALCSTEEWRLPSNFQRCSDQLQELSQQRTQCLSAPTPATPDSGMAGWFASRPDAYDQPGPKGLYTRYGYAGYSYTTYDIGCVQTQLHPDYKFENTVANGEFMVASSIIGASNALRERAWNPKSMWGWADPLVEKATKAIYDKVFTVFGAITLAIVGLYLLWRSRQSDLSNAMTTAGWAVLVMVVVTAIAQWPTWSANAADKTLMGTLGVVHEAVGPPAQDTPADKCRNPDAAACRDHRQPAARASDTAVEGMLYRNWLRGAFGSAESPTAQKYGPVLYDAKSFTWGELQDIRKDPNQRKFIIEQKQKRWMKVSEQIKTEDPEAYEYLQGTKGMERIGAGFIAILSALFYALFDIVASLLILLGFLIFRWAVIAAPILGTIGLLRPASGGVRRLVNIVVAAIFNILIFGTGAAIYLYAADLIMSTPSLPGWLQVVLIALTGVVGWMLLRPYRRITQLGGTDEKRTYLHLLLGSSRHTVKVEDKSAEDRKRRGEAGETRPRPESRNEQADAPSRPEDARNDETAPAPATSTTSSRRAPAEWTEPDVADEAPSYSIYRPGSGSGDAPAHTRPARRPESVRMSG